MKYFTQWWILSPKSIKETNMSGKTDAPVVKAALTPDSGDTMGASDKLFCCKMVQRKIPLTHREELYHILRMTGPLVRTDSVCLTCSSLMGFYCLMCQKKIDSVGVLEWASVKQKCLLSFKVMTVWHIICSGCSANLWHLLITVADITIPVCWQLLIIALLSVFGFLGVLPNLQLLASIRGYNVLWATGKWCNGWLWFSFCCKLSSVPQGSHQRNVILGEKMEYDHKKLRDSW